MKRLIIIFAFILGLVSISTMLAKRKPKFRPIVKIAMDTPMDLLRIGIARQDPDSVRLPAISYLSSLSPFNLPRWESAYEESNSREQKVKIRDPRESIIVFITTGKTRRRFHSSAKCSGLANAKGITTMSLSEAYKEGRTLCQRCEKRDGNPYPKNEGPVKRQVDRRAKEMARTSSGVTEQLIAHTGFTVSYNQEWLISNWVAYKMNAQRLIKKVDRHDNYIPDPAVNGKSADNNDFRGIKPYCRGHLAPSADMRWSVDSEQECSYLSNIVPQDTYMNSGVWNRIEEYVRNNVSNWGTVYICTGPIVEQGYQTVGANGVVVPQKFFKVLLRYNKDHWAAIGFIINNEECGGNMFNYAVSVDEVEEQTGHNFFYNLPDNTEKEVESKYNRKDW